MTFSSSRRFFRFRLQSMFAISTALTLWLGWNVYVVQQRKATADRLSTHRRYSVEAFEDHEVARLASAEAVHIAKSYAKVQRGMGVSDHNELLPATGAPISGLRGWLGDRWYTRIAVTYGGRISASDQAEIERIRNLFPEAVVRVHVEHDPRRAEYLRGEVLQDYGPASPPFISSPSPAELP